MIRRIALLAIVAIVVTAPAWPRPVAASPQERLDDAPRAREQMLEAERDARRGRAVDRRRYLTPSC